MKGEEKGGKEEVFGGVEFECDITIDSGNVCDVVFVDCSVDV